MPCCWLDPPKIEERNYAGFWDEELSIKNVDLIEEILYSKQWKEF